MSLNQNLKGKHIILGVSGGIAAYKACGLLRRLEENAAEVHVVLTAAAQRFVTPLTFQALSKNPVHMDLFSLTEEREMSHIELADKADLILIAPATADLIGRLAHGLADDLLSTLVLASKAPLLLAPAMNVNMWEHPALQSNLKILRERGAQVIEPDSGSLACGWEGKGRLAEEEKILKEVFNFFDAKSTGKKKSLHGKKILINAGPTREYLDPVRFITNPSSGKMGFALAAKAAERGAEVTLVSGPVNLPTPPGVQRLEASSADGMLKACQKYFSTTHLFIATAAVGDYRVEKTATQKMKKNGHTLNLKLIPNLDILKTLALQKKSGQIVVGFAAETEQVLKHAQKKLKEKKLDLIIANDVSQKNTGFASDLNQVTLIDRHGKIQGLPNLAKTQLAEFILDEIEKLFTKKLE